MLKCNLQRVFWNVKHFLKPCAHLISNGTCHSVLEGLSLIDQLSNELLWKQEALIMPYFHYSTWKGSQALSLWQQKKEKEATLVIYGTVKDLTVHQIHFHGSYWCVWDGGGDIVQHPSGFLALFDNEDTIVSTLLSLCVPFDFGDHYAHSKQTEGANTSLISEWQRLGAQKVFSWSRGEGGNAVNAHLWRPAPPPRFECLSPGGTLMWASNGLTNTHWKLWGE